MKAILTISAALAAAASVMAIAPAASAVPVRLQFTETIVNSGPMTLNVTWSTDPSATFNVTGTTDNWMITLLNHTASGGGDFPFQPSDTFTWRDADGTYSNLKWINDTTFDLTSEDATAINPLNEGFGIFHSGNSIFAGTDTNQDVVFAAINENVVPEPASMAVFSAGLLGLAMLRRRRA